MLPYEKLLRDIRKVTSWDAFTHIQAYFQSHLTDYTDQQADEINGSIAKKLAFFNPEDCTILEAIELFGERPVTIHQHEAQSICANAHSANMPLSKYILSVYPSIHDFRIEERIPTTYEKELAKEIFGAPVRNRATQAEREEGVLRVEMDKAGLFNELQRLRTEFSEEAEDLRAVLQKEIRELNAQIVKLRSGEPVTKEELQKPYSRTEEMDSLEYKILVKLMARRGAKPLLFRVTRVTRNDYRITLQGKEQDVADLLKEVTARAQETRKEQSKNVGHLSEKQPVEKQYPAACAAYTASTGRKCNRFVGWVAAHISDVMREELGEHFDEQLIDWATIDWTLGSAGPMDSKKAQEIFAAWLLSHKREAGGGNAKGEAIRDLFAEYSLFAEYMALVELKREYGVTDETTLAADWEALEMYGLTPTLIPMEMREADIFFRENAESTLADEIEREKKTYMSRLNIDKGEDKNA